MNASNDSLYDYSDGASSCAGREDLGYWDSTDVARRRASMEAPKNQRGDEGLKMKKQQDWPAMDATDRATMDAIAESR
jgi:hypothetical protein